ncbi:hypothetical protein NX059_004129 [Plenodomus lindquistii]|nr:hypothetical protein NX059_004129 [Plenodomus lindquistii]
MLSLAMAPNADLTAQLPPARIPKLRYRNPLPADQTSLSSQHSQDSGSASASVQDRSTTPDSTPASTTSRPSCDTASLSPPSLASTTSSTASSNGSSRSSKKKTKATSVFSFLSLKEPSQSALDQFAEQQRKQAAEKASTTTLHKTTTNYANQKLPANVPKVNSKWDGVPQVVRKNRNSLASASSKDGRSSVTSRGSSSTHVKSMPWNDSRLTIMTDGTRNPPNSVISPRPSISNMTNGGSPLASSPSPTTLPDISFYFPDDEDNSGAPPNMSPEENGPSNEVPPRLSDSTWGTRSSIDESLDFRPDSPASSTDSVDTVVRETADTIFRKLNDQPHQNLWGDDAHTAHKPGGGHVPDSHDFLFADEQHVVDREKNDSPMADSPVLPLPAAPASVPYYAPARPVQNFSRPTSFSEVRTQSLRSMSMPSYRRTPSASALPTLYEVSLASSTESLATIRDNGDRDEDTHSIAPSTIAPSELSKHWYESPRERLGLGGRLTMNDVSPWDNQGDARGKPKKSRLSMFGLGTRS